MTFVLGKFHKGSSLPGMLVYKFDKDILKTLSDQYRVILVTGTNGKTTTASLISKIISDAGHSVINNASGANMLSGIITLFIKHENDPKKEFAVIEIDEASVRLYSSIAKAECIVCTNIFKDQLDRYGEIYTTLDKINDGIKKLNNVKIVLAGDEPLFHFINGDKIYYGFNKMPIHSEENRSNIEGIFCPKCNNKYKYDFFTYNHLGKYRCEKCGYSRPLLKYSVKDILAMKDNYTEFTVDNNVHIKTHLSGLFNIYNILAAYSATKELGIDTDKIVNSIVSFKPKFGRYETIDFFNKTIRLILVKNPVGFNQSLRLAELNNDTKYSCFLLNDNYADGRDVSWIWDVDFENNFYDFSKIYVSGIRRYDMYIRLMIAGYNKNALAVENDLHSLLYKLKSCKDGSTIYIYATYTAMISFRRYLAKEKLVRYSW